MSAITGMTKAEAGQRRRRMILQTARDLFIERGFDAVSIDDIIARSGGSKATLYSYFGNKHGLFAALVAEEVERLMEEAPLLRMTDLSPREALGRFLSAMVSRALSEQVMPFIRLAVVESRRFPELAEAYFKTGPMMTRQAVEEYLAGATSRGQLAVPDPHLAAQQLVGAVIYTRLMGILLGLEDYPSPEEVQRGVFAGVDMFLAAYGR